MALARCSLQVLQERGRRVGIPLVISAALLTAAPPAASEGPHASGRRHRLDCADVRLPDLEARLDAMAGPLGREDAPLDPPFGCEGAEAFVSEVRQRYERGLRLGGCTGEPPELGFRVLLYEWLFARRHDFETHEIERDGFTIFAREFGREHAGKGPTIVLMHGYPDGQQLYDLVAPGLGETHHTVTFDFLGYGRSELPPPNHVYTDDGLRRDLEAVLEYFDPEHVVPVVHDASGFPGIDWALDNPDRVTALVLLNTFYMPVIGTTPPEIVRGLMLPALCPALLEALAGAPVLSRAAFETQVGRFFSRRSRRNVFLPLFAHRQPKSSVPLFGLTEGLLVDVLQRGAEVPRMRSFPKPVEVVFGADDPYLNPEIARAFADTFPNSNLVLVNGGAHYVQLDRPRRVIRQIRRAAQP